MMRFGRKNKLLLTITILVICLNSWAYNTFDSSHGGLFVQSPETNINHLCINLYNGYSYSVSDFIYTGNIYSGQAGAYRLSAGIAYGFTEWIEMSVNTGFMTDILNSGDPASSMLSYGFRDSRVGLKINGNFLADMPEVFNAGVYTFFNMSTGALYDTIQYTSSVFGSSYLRNEGGVFRNYTENGNGTGVIGLIGLKTDNPIPMFLNINAGYEWRNPASNADSIDPAKMLYGISAMADFGPVIPVLEFYGSRYMSEYINGGMFTGIIRPGIRIRAGNEFAFDVSCGIAVLGYRDTLIINDENILLDEAATEGFGNTPFWEASIGISYCRDVSIRPKPIIIERKKTLITGRIIDKESGKPLKAVVTMPGYIEDVSVIADSNGLYTLDILPGKHRVRVDIDGYKWQETEISIREGETKIFDFRLNVKQSSIGKITGIVMDKAGGFPLSAKVYLPGTDIEPGFSSSSTGTYELEAIEGKYQIAAVLEGYASFIAGIEITGSETLVFNIDMLKKGGKLELKGINFESGLATIKPESYILLDEAVELLKNNPKVRIEIQGHTDNVGSSYSNQILSQARAEAVRNYLISYGISSKRIVAKGYGSSMPVASNNTPEGRAKNRRIEFLIIGE